MTDLCRLCEWTTRAKSYFPQDSPPKGRVGHRVDNHVRPLRNRWVYALVRRYDTGGAYEIPFEAWVDDEGIAWYGEYDPTVPILDRGDPREGYECSAFVQFPKLNESGNALQTRLLCSPFRLPSKALRAINEKGYHKSLTNHVAPMWSWEKGENPDSPIVSKDGYSPVVEPLWMTFEGESAPTPVLVGTDPFKIAENRSNLYVRNRGKYSEVFEPTTTEAKKKLSKMMLAQSINDAILEVPEAWERYGKAVDIPRVNKELQAWDDLRIELKKKVDRSGENLCKFMRADLFSLLHYASLEEENYVTGELTCEATLEQLKILDTVTRQLDRCKAGGQLLLDWTRDADKDDQHFLSRSVLPSKPLPVHVFKSLRWGGKGALNLFRKLGPYLLARKSNVLKAAGELMEYLGVIEKFDVAGFVKKTSIAAADLARTHGFQLKGNRLLELELLGKQAPLRLIEYADSGKNVLPRLPEEMGSSRFLAFAVLDAINVTIAIDALRKAEGLGAIATAGAGVGAALGFFVASIAQPIVEALPEGGAKTRWLRRVYGTQAACAVVYAALDFIAASDAFSKDDNDRAVFLLAAGLAESGAAVAYGVMAVSTAGGPAAVAVVVLGAVAAAAYIAAMIAEDDPLYEFLRYCEWGSEKYAKELYEPSWADKPVFQWAGDYELQLETLVRVLSRLTITWNLKSWPAVDVSTSMLRPGARFDISHDATYADGSTSSDEHVRRADELPPTLPVKFRVESNKPYLAHSAREITVTVRYRADFDADEEKLTARLMWKGTGIPNGKKTRVE